MHIRNIIKNAIQLAWSNKVLWVFGTFASCGYSSSPDSDFLTSIGFGFGSSFLLPLSFGAFLLILISIFANFALSKGSYKILKGKSISFSQLFNDGKAIYARALGLSVIGFAASSAILMLGGFLFIAASSTIENILVPLLIIFIPLLIISGLIISIASTNIIIEDAGVIDSLNNAWLSIRSEFGQWINLTLSLFFAVFAYGLLLLIPIILVIFLIAFLFYDIGLVVAGLLTIILIPMIAAAGGFFFSAYQITWISGYLEIYKARE